MRKLLFAGALLAMSVAMIPAPMVAVAQGYGQGGWDTPPQEYRDIERQGFHDGIEGARKDFENHRPPATSNRDEFRHPNVPARDRAAYRNAFTRGYRVGWDHINGHGGPRPY
jgi:hypothetical protein